MDKQVFIDGALVPTITRLTEQDLEKFETPPTGITREPTAKVVDERIFVPLAPQLDPGGMAPADDDVQLICPLTWQSLTETEWDLLTVDEWNTLLAICTDIRLLAWHTLTLGEQDLLTTDQYFRLFP